MTDKLTDNDIVKALECCCEDSGCPAICPLKDMAYVGDCVQVKSRHALDLINRLQAENERLQNRVDEYNIQVANQREQIEKYEPIKETLCVLWENMLSISVARGKEKPTLEELAEAVDYIKAEAYREFAERLKEKMVKHNFKYADTLFSANVATAPMVNNLLKEMEGAAGEIED